MQTAKGNTPSLVATPVGQLLTYGFRHVLVNTLG